MNLLVTGGAGFIGSNLIHQIIGKPEIRKLVNLDCLTYAGDLANLDGIHGVHPRYVFEKVDLRDAAEVRRVVREHDITHVIHAAAESHVDRSIAGPGDFITTNVNGTFHLLEACREHWQTRCNGNGNGNERAVCFSNAATAEHGPAAAGEARGTAHRFLQVSTDEVYGSLGPDDPPFTEASPCAPNSPYSASKAAGDMLVRSYHKTYGLPALITRCSNNYGPRQHAEKFIPVVIQSLLARRPIPVYGDGSNIRDWLHVEDHCSALWLVLTQGKPGETYNIGGGNELSNLQLVECLCDLFDELRPHLGGSSRSLITFVADRPGHDWRYAVDAGKIHGEFGWSPLTHFAAGVRGEIVN